jgi:hypothetical protein
MNITLLVLEGVSMRIHADTLSWYGPTTGYDYPQSKEKEQMSLSFELSDPTMAGKYIVELETRQILARTGHRYGSDRERFYITLTPGYCGMKNPPSFELRPITVAKSEPVDARATQSTLIDPH